MPCPRCLVDPVMATGDRPGAVRLDAVPDRVLDREDEELLHIERDDEGGVDTSPPPPTGWDNPCICSLCGGVYYPRLRE